MITMHNLNNQAYDYIGGMKIVISPDHKTYRYELRKVKTYGNRQNTKNIRIKIQGWANMLEDDQTVRMGDTVIMNLRARDQLEKNLNAQNTQNNASNSI